MIGGFILMGRKKKVKEKLEEILTQHQLWVESGFKEGERANLIGADLYKANLREADLYKANLIRANLIRANLYNIENKSIITFQAGKHFAYSCDGFIKIGCITKPIDEWLETYKEVGEREDYTEVEIEAYGGWIKLIKHLTMSFKR